MKRALVVGAGLSGLTAAVMLTDQDYRVTVLDKRPVFGGNCIDICISSSWVHKYGPHILHTNDKEVWDFILRFTEIRKYEHRVLARTDVFDELVPIPYSMKTEKVIGRSLSDQEILDIFFKTYSKKMWGMQWDELPEEIRNRVPQRRVDEDDRYFTDTYQGLPEHGYMGFFASMVNYIRERKGQVLCGVSRDEWRHHVLDSDLTVFTGSIDEYYQGMLGWLPYKTLNIVRDYVHHITPAAVNECNLKHTDATRETNYRVLHPLDKDATISGRMPTTVEYPVGGTININHGNCFYPISWGNSMDLYRDYEKKNPKARVVFAGRLGAYKYMNMDVTIRDTMDRLKNI